MELKIIVNQIKLLKEQQVIVEKQLDEMKYEFLKLNGLDETYEDEEIKIIPMEDLEYLKINLKELKKNLLEVLNEDKINHIFETSKIEIKKSGGVTIRLKK
ncbi:MAG: hypothetical protein IAE93_05870 [Ignavibacteria bacterium]|nr:hypothetical protein [Ignavibacteria bacterium]